MARSAFFRSASSKLVRSPASNFEVFFEHVGIVEMPPANKRGRVVAPLAHLPGTGNTHRPEEQSYSTFGVGDQTIWLVATTTEITAINALAGSQQRLIGGQRILASNQGGV